ncbi:MAG: matrixin family metalloprotease, partial [Pseudomonas sp.]|nr:matrixin family metalloprotease [Pseudomonas sp.]
MSKLKEKAALSVGQVQAASASSSAFTQIDNFSHFYDRGDHLVNGKPSLTTDQAADQLTRSGASWHDLNGDGVINLTYTFLTAPPVGYATRGLGTFSQFSSLQKEQAKLSLESWADVAKVTFTEGAAVRGGDGHMTFANFSASNGGAAFAYLPSSSRKGESWYLINKDYEVNKTPGEGNYGRQTLTHEIGHTLGLSHPGDYNAGNGNPTYRDAVYGEDTRAYSVMSYWSE